MGFQMIETQLSILLLRWLYPIETLKLNRSVSQFSSLQAWKVSKSFFRIENTMFNDVSKLIN